MGLRRPRPAQQPPGGGGGGGDNALALRQPALIWGQRGLDLSWRPVPASSPGSCSKHGPGVSLRPLPAPALTAAKSLPRMQMGQVQRASLPPTHGPAAHPRADSGRLPHSSLACARAASLLASVVQPGPRPEVSALAHTPAQMARSSLFTGSLPCSADLRGSPLQPTQSPRVLPPQPCSPGTEGYGVENCKFKSWVF